MTHRTALALLALATTVVAGCGGRNPSLASQVDLTISHPEGSNVNLTRIRRGSNFQRTTSGSLVVTMTESPGPTGITNRIVRVTIPTPEVGAEYGLVAGGTTLVEMTETISGGTRTWVSTGGKLTLVRHDDDGTTVSLTDVTMGANNAAARGAFRLNGSIAVRF